jgi:hypothetical protein
MFRTLLLAFLILSAFSSPSWADAQITNSYVVYSPTLIRQQGQTVMYSGGWATPQDSQDTIYRSVCTTPANCSPPQAVLKPQDYGMGLFNDPSIVQIDNYLIMYMTVVADPTPGAGFTTTNNATYYSTSWANDGVNWSQPQLLLSDLWTPCATVGPNNHILVYGTSNIDAQMYVYDTGPTGNMPTSKQLIHVYDPATNNELPNNYTNINVTYWPQYQNYQMLGVNFELTQIDYLTSTDGINFYLEGQNVVPTEPGSQITSPTNWLDSYCSVYYGKVYNGLPIGSGGTLNIFMHSWC